MRRSGMLCTVLAAAALLAGCSTVLTVVEADAVIAGKTYREAPIPLGKVRMRLLLQAQVVESVDTVMWIPVGGDKGADPEQVDITLGFVATGEPTSVVARGGTLRSRKDGAEAELVARFQAQGTSIECVAQAGRELELDYWFNGTVKPDLWRCVTLRFRLAGHTPADPLELTLEPVNVGGRPVRVLPISFDFRTAEVSAD